MENFLAYLVAILFLIVICVMFNDKALKLPTEIAILIFSLIIGIVLKTVFFVDDSVSLQVMSTISEFRIDKVLMDGLLCFMLFSGASELKLPSLVNNFKPIALLALLTTVIASVIYGALFYLVSLALGLNISFTLCVLLGSIVSPTDPIAATSILGKMGLTKNVTAVMEAESLFNDGTGVALFIFVRELYLDTKGNNFFVVMGKELFGALIVGVAVSFVLSFFVKATEDPIKHILISLLSVSFCYVLCEKLEYSGVIASVVCGIYFSTMMDKYRAKDVDLDPDNYYKDFWSIIDKLLNYVLYAMIGISFVYITKIQWLVIVAIAAVIFNLVARYLGVLISTVLLRQCPDDYKIKPFTLLMTWSGLKGGLCLALAMSTIDFLPSEPYHIILYITYVTIIFTTVFQGLSVGRVFEHIKQKENAEVSTK